MKFTLLTMRAEPIPKKTSGGSGGALPPDSVLFGNSAAMAPIRLRAEKICQMNIPVLLCGAGGTGKEALAKWIHDHSLYRDGQFVKVNCAAIPGTLLESELFGYERGAFTGAQSAKPGRVEMAHQGTLFLDEIAELDAGLQSKLLHFLQDGCFSRIGDHAERNVETRVICATNRDLEAEIRAGRFRADLFYRINVVRLRLPRLRERREDIPEIAEYFRQLYEKQFACLSEPLGIEVLGHLKNLDWPGNVRELANGIARYVLIGPESLIAPTLPRRTAALNPGSEGSRSAHLKGIAKDAIRETERKVILQALRENQWNRRKTAQALQISYRALIYKIRDAGLGSRPAGLMAAPGTTRLRQPSSE